jgi:hypothetical protein
LATVLIALPAELLVAPSAHGATGARKTGNGA